MTRRVYRKRAWRGHPDLGAGERFTVSRGGRLLGQVSSRPLYDTWDGLRPFDEGGEMATGLASKRAAADWLEAMA